MRSKKTSFFIQLISLRKGDAIAKAGEDRDKPEELVITKDLLEVVELAQVEGQTIRTTPEDRGTESFQS